ncbi:MAG: hypothetical protein KDB61_05920, partial [Planctomycetes bacterium]|nr:hypothetical protein [Planctomycetota bacterium]
MKLATCLGVLWFSALAGAQTVLLEIDGSPYSEDFSTSLIAFPDVDSDGVPEILSTGSAGNGSQSYGRAFLFSGGDGHLIYSVPGRDGANFSRPPAVLGDVNGDGIADWGALQTGNPKNSI